MVTIFRKDVKKKNDRNFWRQSGDRRRKWTETKQDEKMEEK